MKKRILFLTHHIEPSKNPNGYRIGQYFPFFHDGGFDVMHLTSKAGKGSLLRALRDADVVYVQRLLPGSVKRLLLKAYAKKIVFDFDDAIMYGRPDGNGGRQRRFKSMVSMATAVFCGNAFLQAQASRYRSRNTFIVPTVVDTSDYPVKDQMAGRADPFVVGWMGSSSTLKYLTDLAPLISAPPANTCFKVVADRSPELDEPWVSFEPWSAEREKALLLSFDVGIMPTRNDLWSQGKCGLKLIQYASSGLPSVSHPVGASCDIIEDGESGFLREDTEGWKEAFERLRLDPDLRRRMGKRARAIAEEKYSLKVWGPRLVDLVSSL